LQYPDELKRHKQMFTAPKQLMPIKQKAQGNGQPKLASETAGLLACSKQAAKA